MKDFLISRRIGFALFCVLGVSLSNIPLQGQDAAAGAPVDSNRQVQNSGGNLSGTVLDVQGKGVQDATVTVTNKVTNATRTQHTDVNGNYAIPGLLAGTYKVEASAIGFSANSKSDVTISIGQSVQVSLSLTVSSVLQQIEVNAGIESIAAETAPSGGFLEERSAQSLIANAYIRNFTSPIADYGSIVNIVPGAFTISSDGVGLGQSKTSFRGFPDGDFDIDFDGVPFYDTNSPTHHSWAFFPGQWIGGVDFDRSPGTASTTGPTPFGGSIHLLSMPLNSEEDIRGTVSYGTWNTKLYEGSYNSGPFGIFGTPKKSNLFVDVHHMTSDGYQTFNFNTRNAGSLLYQYQLSPKTVITGFSGVIQLTANTYGLNPTRCQTLASTPSALCASTVTVTSTKTAYNTTPSGILPYTGYGYNFEMVNNSDPTNWLDYQYNHYRVPTDFEYVGVKSDIGKGWYIDFKGYTYNYDNGELYTNATPITEVTQAAGLANPSLVPGSFIAPNSKGAKTLYYNGVAVSPCDVIATGKTSATTGLTVYSEPCGVDKYNSYRKYGETATVSQTSRFGVLRAGMWFDWARTKRHQYPSDPLSGWADQSLPNFDETFYTDSYQPFAEYEFHITPKFNVTAGNKFAYYTYNVIHKADDGKTVGPLTCASTIAACSATATDTGSFYAPLPSLDFNYRIQNDWAIYAQASTGSIVPPSTVYDFSHTPTATDPTPGLLTPPKQQKSTTYQMGTVFKANKISIDADAYRVRFQNSYSSVIDPTTSETVNFLQPSSITQGVEFETTAVLTKGLDLYLNATAANAYYEGKLNAGTPTSPLNVDAPSGLWVQGTPADTEMQGLTYSDHGFDLGLFNKRVGEQHVDAGAYHNQAIIAPFSDLTSYINFTVRNHSIFDGTKISLSGDNLLNQHNMTALTLSGTSTSNTIAGTTYTDPFNQTTPISGADQPTFMSARSLSVSVTFGFAPRERK
jgi:iron complex outermembrane receptor protein